MKKRRSVPLDFEVDKLTNSIENIITGDRFLTEVLLLTKEDLKDISKRNGWLFNWKMEAKQLERELYKLVIAKYSSGIQGLLSLETKTDHVFMHLLENAAFNRGKTKVYAGVAGNLVAFACLLSFRRGFEGNVSFFSKSKLVDHYIKTLGAFHAGRQRMIIETKVAQHLIDKYFKN